MLNLDGITTAQEKAITAGGTKNAVIGGSLVKRGVMEKTEAGEFPYMLTAEFMNYRDAAIISEHGTKPVPAPLDVVAEPTEEEQIDALRAEFETADEQRREEIRNALARLGTVVYPAGTPQYEEYRKSLRDALAAPDAFAGLMNGEAVKVDAETILATMDADDAAALQDIGGTIGSGKTLTETRDPQAVRYADIRMWTDARLDMMEERTERRLRGKLFARERSQAYSHLAAIKAEIERRAELASK